MPAGSASSNGRATPPNARQAAPPQTSDEMPTAVVPRKARRPYRLLPPAALTGSVSLDDEPAIHAVAQDLCRRIAVEGVEGPAVVGDLRPAVRAHDLAERAHDTGDVLRRHRSVRDRDRRPGLCARTGAVHLLVLFLVPRVD